MVIICAYVDVYVDENENYDDGDYDNDNNMASI